MGDIGSISKILGWGKDFFIWLFGDQFKKAAEWTLDLLYKLFDNALTIVTEFLQSIPVPSAWSNISDPWAGFPGQVYYILDLFNVGTCLAILAGAYGVRFLLNLIPGALTRV